MKRIFQFLSVALVILATLVACTIHFASMEFRMPRESLLKVDLYRMRKAIEEFTADKKTPPRSLQELVKARYLVEIPQDPFTGKQDWVVVFGDVCSGPQEPIRGMNGVHSASQQTGSDGTPYNTW